MRRNWMGAATLILAAAGMTAQGPGGFGGRGPGFGEPGFGGPRQVVTGKPFTASATESSVDKLSDGTTISHSSTLTEARDADGRTVRIVTTTQGSGQTVTRTSVFDPVTHTATDWSSTSTLAVQFQLPATPPAGGPRGPRPGPGGPGRPEGPGPGRIRPEVSTSTLAPKTIAGDSATGVQTTLTIPAGAEGNDQPLVSTRQVYTSTDLGIVLSETSTSPRDGIRTFTVNSLSLSTPDPALFQVPANYTVKTETRHRGM